jgi:hypothetical protein
MDVFNLWHRIAQMTGRTNVEFYVGLALKGRAESRQRGSSRSARGDHGGHVRDTPIHVSMIPKRAPLIPEEEVDYSHLEL